MQNLEDRKSVSGRCYCGLSAGAYGSKVKGQSEVERPTTTPWKPTQRERATDMVGQREWGAHINN